MKTRWFRKELLILIPYSFFSMIFPLSSVYKVKKIARLSVEKINIAILFSIV